MFDKAYNNSFQRYFDSLQCKAWLAITCVVEGSFTTKIYQELGLESLKNRQWFPKLCNFCKIVQSSPQNINLT